MTTSTDDLKFGTDGLIPAVVQDARTREVLTLAYMNRESLERTLMTQETWFWSRSRQELWHKGKTSGNTQQVVSISWDCDLDALLVRVIPQGPACHLGERSCFHNDLSDDRLTDKRESKDFGTVLTELYSVIESRKAAKPESSYTSYLFSAGIDKILKKIGEESAETIVAAKNESREALVSESADLIYHLMVLFVERGITLGDLASELISRRRRSRANDRQS